MGVGAGAGVGVGVGAGVGIGVGAGAGVGRGLGCVHAPARRVKRLKSTTPKNNLALITLVLLFQIAFHIII